MNPSSMHPALDDQGDIILPGIKGAVLTMADPLVFLQISPDDLKASKRNSKYLNWEKY